MAAVFISWIGHHGRSAAIASALGAETHFITGGAGSAPARYARAGVVTRRLLRRRQARPSAAIVMLPPLPALLCTAISRPSLRIAGDLHSGVFNDPKWSWALGITMRTLRRRGIAIVTNGALADVCRSHGVEAVVLHDVIEDFAEAVPETPEGLVPRAYVLFPVTYAADEPLEAVLAAAASTPSTTFVLTGRAPEDLRRRAASNVVFTGFVSQERFEALLRNAGAVAALTTREDTMQRAGYEALSAGVPIIASSTAVLREYFDDAAAFTDATSESLRSAIAEILADRPGWVERVIEAKARKQAEQAAGIAKLREWLGS